MDIPDSMSLQNSNPMLAISGLTNGSPSLGQQAGGNGSDNNYMAAAARLLQNPALQAAMQNHSNPTHHQTPNQNLQNALSGINPALAAQLQASTAAQMGSHPPVSGLDLSNLTAMHAMLQKQNELLGNSNGDMTSQGQPPAEDVKIEEVDEIHTVNPTSPAAPEEEQPDLPEADMSQVVNQETAEIIEAKTEPLENEENMQE